jgi:hypothetical protein
LQSAWDFNVADFEGNWLSLGPGRLISEVSVFSLREKTLMATSSIQDLARVTDQRLKRHGVVSPGKRLLARLFEVVFFTTLKSEEGRPLQLRIVLVDPNDPDPERPLRPRPGRWRITKLRDHLPLTVPTLTKLSKAADPWNSSLAVHYNQSGEFFVWGLVDQTIHFNRMLVREAEGGYAPPGLFQVLASGPADLSVYRGFSFIARLAQDTLLKSQTDIFWSGPISDGIDEGIQRYLFSIERIVGKNHADEWIGAFADKWIATLCRILISIQRYRHGGALLITRGRSQLDVKYGISYRRLPIALTNLGIARIKASLADEELDKYLDDPNVYEVPALAHLDQAIAESDADDYEDEITGCVRFISSLSCVDGLIFATPDLAIRGFGVEIRTKKEPAEVFLASRPRATGKSLRRIDPHHYGTRHRSMMRYCFANPKSIGFVISQDGEIRVMTKVKKSLVMWENLKVLSFFEEDFKKTTPNGQSH